MKKILMPLLVALAMFISAPAFAGEGGGKKPEGGKHHHHRHRRHHHGGTKGDHKDHAGKKDGKRSRDGASGK